MSAESSKTDPAVRSDVTTFLGGKQKRNPLANTIFSVSVKTRCEQLKMISSLFKLDTSGIPHFRFKLLTRAPIDCFL